MDHNKFIAKNAKDKLKPLGFIRHGKSRLWFKDFGWWATVVEFQPSSWSKGTYVNVAVSEFLFEKPYWAYTDTTRVQGFANAENNDFEKTVYAMTDEAIKEATSRIEKYQSVDAWLSCFSHEDRRSVWDDYYCGVFNSLNGDFNSARDYYSNLIARKCSHLFEQGVQLRAKELLYLMQDRDLYKGSLKGVVLRSRNMQNIEGFDISNLLLPWK